MQLGASGREVEVARYQGMGETRRDERGSSYRWAQIAPDDPSPRLPPGAAGDATRAVMRRWDERPAALARLDELARAIEADGSGRVPRFDVSLRHFDQRVVAGDAERALVDERGYATIGVQARSHAGAGGRPLRREGAFRDLDALENAWRDVVARLVAVVDESSRRDDPEPVRAGEHPVLLDAGPCALFFHEVCGHPMEGDILASGTSYLSGREGERVASEALTVVDDPAAPRSVAGYRVDDEGTPAAPVALVDRGVVGEPLLDVDTARRAGRAPNGHGRRMSFMYPAVPRQAYTRIVPHAAEPRELASTIGYGLLVRRLRLRHMNVATGDFSFYVNEAHVVHGGEAGAFAAPCVVRGNALDALAAVDGVGRDAASFLGGGGCGKLDQGPLVVGFEQPSVRIAALRVTPEGAPA